MKIYFCFTEGQTFRDNVVKYLFCHCQDFVIINLINLVYVIIKITSFKNSCHFKEKKRRKVDFNNDNTGEQK